MFGHCRKKQNMNIHSCFGVNITKFMGDKTFTIVTNILPQGCRNRVLSIVVTLCLMEDFKTTLEKCINMLKYTTAEKPCNPKVPTNQYSEIAHFAGWEIFSYTKLLTNLINENKLMEYCNCQCTKSFMLNGTGIEKI